jgi:hypothetical protein
VIGTSLGPPVTAPQESHQAQVPSQRQPGGRPWCFPTSHFGSATCPDGSGPTHSVTDAVVVGRRPGSEIAGTDPAAAAEGVSAAPRSGETDGAVWVDKSGDGDGDSRGTVGATATFATPARFE